MMHNPLKCFQCKLKYLLLLLLAATACSAKKEVINTPADTNEIVSEWRIEVSMPGSGIGFLNTMMTSDDENQRVIAGIFKGTPIKAGKRSIVFYNSCTADQLQQVKNTLYNAGFVKITAAKLNQ